MAELAGRTEATHCSYYTLTFVDLLELGRSSQAMAELAGRTEAMVTDVMMALVEMGQYGFRRLTVIKMVSTTHSSLHSNFTS